MRGNDVGAIICVHSFNRGTGRSTLVANLAALLAADGYRVGAVDTDFQSPSLHKFFKLPESEIRHTVNEYLWGECLILDTAHDVTPRGKSGRGGKVYLLPASSKPGDILLMLRDTYDYDEFYDGLCELAEAFKLDYLILDTAAGLNEDTLLSIANAHTLVILLRPEQEDYQGTAVTMEVARNLEVPRVFLVLNNAPDNLGFDKARQQLEDTYHCEVAGLLPQSEKVEILGDTDALAWFDPADPFVTLLKRLVERLIA